MFVPPGMIFAASGQSRGPDVGPDVTRLRCLRTTSTPAPRASAISNAPPNAIGKNRFVLPAMSPPFVPFGWLTTPREVAVVDFVGTGVGSAVGLAEAVDVGTAAMVI